MKKPTKEEIDRVDKWYREQGLKKLEKLEKIRQNKFNKQLADLRSLIGLSITEIDFKQENNISSISISLGNEDTKIEWENNPWDGKGRLSITSKGVLIYYE